MNQRAIGIIDYGMGNLASIRNMLKHVGAGAIITRDPREIELTSGLILPGVGAFDTGMRHIRDLGLESVLKAAVQDRGVPVLGICLGMHLLTAGSEEGNLAGLGWIPGYTRRFHFDNGQARGLKVPHMGWNTARIRGANPLLEGFETPPRFYFVHSYHITTDADYVVGETEYGYAFPSIVGRGNVFGTQFHPEKSHRFGMRLLSNFARIANA